MKACTAVALRKIVLASKLCLLLLVFEQCFLLVMWYHYVEDAILVSHGSQGYTTLADLQLHGAGKFHGPCNDFNDAYNVSTPTPGRFKVSEVLGLGKDGGKLDTLPDWEVRHPLNRLCIFTFDLIR